MGSSYPSDESQHELWLGGTHDEVPSGWQEGKRDETDWSFLQGPSEHGQKRAIFVRPPKAGLAARIMLSDVEERLSRHMRERERHR